MVQPYLDLLNKTFLFGSPDSGKSICIDLVFIFGGFATWSADGSTICKCLSV